MTSSHSMDRNASGQCLESARPAIRGRRIPSEDQEPVQGQTQIVNLAAERLRRELANAIADIERWKRAKADRDALRRPMHDQIDVDLAQEFGPACYETEHPNYEAFKKERCRRRARATRQASKTIYAKFGLKRLSAAPGSYVLKATTGLGKTSEALHAIAGTTSLQFDWFAPSHTLIDQCRGDLEVKAPDRALGTACGRAARDPKELCVGNILMRKDGTRARCVPGTRLLDGWHAPA